ncbi:TetR family transcriptional regulator [Egibacter rhizosphaerae]|uniref:TetR family transcriptional regulator n=1 Tax=Egibacter rhizosphaerae TaxID=1670831 RepID=A0A411YGD6_9ACTN|nr:TetR family transcriptional regulator [Egibacter rhizosphaerae]QBI20211.1 TetR family transcriptional regulator [Egibacter rhizosphaerae]
MSDDEPLSTRARLRTAALDTVHHEGIVGTSARAIARRADANQALIFYHFGTVDQLLAEASRSLSQQRARAYRERLAAVTTMRQLATAARELHHEERASGTVATLAQLIAGARTFPLLAQALRENLDLLTEPVADTLGRLVGDTPLEAVVPADELARSVAAGFVGLELVDDLHEHHDPELFSALDGLATLADALRDAGALEASWLRRRLR